MTARTKPIYYFADGKRRRGPFTFDEIRQYPLQSNTLVWREGLAVWTPLIKVPELWAVFAEMLVEPPPEAAAYQMPAPPPDVRQAALLGEVPQTGFFGDPSSPPPLGAEVSKLSVASAAVGLGSMLAWCLPGGAIVAPLGALAAVVLGGWARRRSARSGAGGDVWAVLGIIVGVTGLLIAAVIAGMLLYFSATMPAPDPAATQPGGGTL